MPHWHDVNIGVSSPRLTVKMPSNTAQPRSKRVVAGLRVMSARTGHLCTGSVVARWALSLLRDCRRDISMTSFRLTGRYCLAGARFEAIIRFIIFAAYYRRLLFAWLMLAMRFAAAGHWF